MVPRRFRVLKAVGESSFWKRAGHLHSRLYRATHGWVGHWSGVTNLLLTTIGRKSGVERTVPLAYITDGDTFVVVASNGGADRHPAWWLNLQQVPQGRIQIGNDSVDVVAAKADGRERARLWPMLKQANPFYGWYEQITDRDIPVVILRRARP
jgi:deazaflavin-dependent oxidoreductase (nitroreductase family)